jgi:hypothetical protein
MNTLEIFNTYSTTRFVCFLGDNPPPPNWARGSSFTRFLDHVYGDRFGYKSEGRWFDPSWCHWNFSLTLKSFRSHYGPGVDSASYRNEYQEHFRPVRKAANLTTILCRCHEIWEP